MSNENIDVPSELIEALTQVLKSHRGVGKSDQRPIKALIALLKKYDELLSKHVSEESIQKEAFTQIMAAVKGEKQVF